MSFFLWYSMLKYMWSGFKYFFENNMLVLLKMMCWSVCVVGLNESRCYAFSRNRNKSFIARVGVVMYMFGVWNGVFVFGVSVYVCNSGLFVFLLMSEFVMCVICSYSVAFGYKINVFVSRELLLLFCFLMLCLRRLF